MTQIVSFSFNQDWPDFTEPGRAEIIDIKNDTCTLVFACPECGKVGGIKVGFKHKPKECPSWILMSGDPENVRTWTLSPSINCVGCCGWHGFLQNGNFV